MRSIIVSCLVILILLILFIVVKTVIYNEKETFQTGDYVIINRSIDYETECYFIDIECKPDLDWSELYNDETKWDVRNYIYTARYGNPYTDMSGFKIMYPFYKLSDSGTCFYDLAEYVKFLLINNQERVSYYQSATDAEKFETLSTYNIVSSNPNINDRIISRLIINDSKYVYGSIYKFTLGIVPYESWDNYNSNGAIPLHRKRYAFQQVLFNDWKCPENYTQSYTYKNMPRIMS